MTFNNPVRYGKMKELFIAPEGLYTGQVSLVRHMSPELSEQSLGWLTLGCPQFVYAGKKATLTIGNVKPVGDMPEGTIICNVEEVCTVA